MHKVSAIQKVDEIEKMAGMHENISSDQASCSEIPDMKKINLLIRNHEVCKID